MIRADAARNRAKILHGARTVIAEHGVGIGMDEIAASSGVAVGTLYRHFPTKQDLVGAVLGELTAEIVRVLDAAVERIDAGADAIDEIGRLLGWVVIEKSADQALRDAAGSLGVGLEAVREFERRAFEMVERMVAAAHAQGRARPDVTAADVVLLLRMVPAGTLPEADRRRWVELAVRSLAV